MPRLQQLGGSYALPLFTFQELVVLALRRTLREREGTPGDRRENVGIARFERGIAADAGGDLTHQ